MTTTTETRPIIALGEFVQNKSFGHSDHTEGSESVEFFHVSRQNQEDNDKEEFLRLIQAAPEGEFQNLTVEELQQGPSYITLGGWLGSQQIALQFIGLLKLLEVGNIVTPATLGITGEEARQMAGMGMVMGILSRDSSASA